MRLTFFLIVELLATCAGVWFDLFCCLGFPLEDGEASLVVSGSEGSCKGGVATLVLLCEVNVGVGEQDARTLRLLA